MKYKLKEIFDLHMGKTPSRNNAEYWNSNEYKWISIADLSKTGKYIRDTKEHLSKQAIDESGIKLIPANTVIMSFKLSIGKTAITAEDMYSNEAIMAFHDKHVVDILPEYLFYMFKFKNWDEGSNKAVMGKTLNKATLYSSEENYNALTYEDTLIVKEEVAPLILSDGDEASAVRFDALMYGIELAYLAGKKYSRARSDLHKKIAGIASVANIPEIQAQTDLINKVLNTDYVDTAGINEFEEIREKLRNLMKYLPNSSIRYDTNFTDEVLSTEWNESELENDDLKNYKAKAEYYIRQHQDNIAIAKLKRNKPLTSTDIAMLEEVLWSEVGTKQDYEQEFGEKPLGEFVREIVGLDMNAAKEAFSEYLTNASLDSRQIYFVNQIVEYIVHNGMMKDLSVLQESPFTDRGSVVEIFTDLSVWMGIRKVIDMINANAVA